MIEKLPRIGSTPWGELVQWSEHVRIHFVYAQTRITHQENTELTQWLNDARTTSQVVNLWEDVWVAKKELVCQRLFAMSGQVTRIHGRACSIEVVTKEEGTVFFETNHIQGNVHAPTSIGLKFNGEWVAMASFGQPRWLKKNYVDPHLSGELIRFCNRAGLRVYGGLDKLLKYYVTQYHVQDIMTYTDLDWSDGVSFKKLGFLQRESKSPMAFELLDGKRVLQNNPDENKRYVWNTGSLKWVGKQRDNGN